MVIDIDEVKDVGLVNDKEKYYYSWFLGKFIEDVEQKVVEFSKKSPLVPNTLLVGDKLFTLLVIELKDFPMKVCGLDIVRVCKTEYLEVAYL